MHSGPPNPGSFKRQVVFRISADDWPLLERAAAAHGSMQAAIVAGLRLLAGSQQQPSLATAEAAQDNAEEAGKAPARGVFASDAGEEITAREAAEALGLKRNTVAGYIRTGRLSGRYEGAPTWRGWLTSRAAVRAYQRRIQARR